MEALMGEKLLKNSMFNWRGGLTGIAGFLLVWGVVFFLAFMTAFGNNTPEARIILQGVSVFFLLRKPALGNSAGV
jgi:hypothetical protein